MNDALICVIAIHICGALSSTQLQHLWRLTASEALKELVMPPCDQEGCAVFGWDVPVKSYGRNSKFSVIVFVKYEQV